MRIQAYCYNMCPCEQGHFFVDYFIHIHVDFVENVQYMLFYNNELTTRIHVSFLIFLWIMWKSP